jgi:hypothetical protein
VDKIDDVKADEEFLTKYDKASWMFTEESVVVWSQNFYYNIKGERVSLFDALDKLVAHATAIDLT